MFRLLTNIWVFTRASTDTFMPEGYTIGDELIVLVNGGRLRHLNNIWPFGATTHDTPAAS